MRTENTSSPALAAARLRAHAVRARRWLWSRAPATRWALAVAVLVASAALIMRGYVATPVAHVVEYLYAGQRFAADEIDAITRALAVKHIKPHVDGMGRIGVPSDQIDEATDVVAKLDVGPRSIPEIRESANQASIWAPLTETERRHTEAREKILESMIRKLDGIVGAYVKINRPRPSGGLRPTSTPTASAFVYLQTERNREIGSKTVQSIQTILRGYESDLKHDAVTVVDQKGHHYLDAGNPALGAISRTRAREEELSQRILEQLDWIKGVSVAVQLPLPPRSRRVPGAASGPGCHAPRPERGARPSSSVDDPQSPPGARPGARSGPGTRPRLGRPRGRAEAGGRRGAGHGLGEGAAELL